MHGSVYCHLEAALRDGGVLALADAPRAGRGHGIAAALEAKIVRLTLQIKPPAPLMHWSSRRLAAKLGVAHTTVTTVWKRLGLKPHRLERYKGSPDPDFEAKAADVIGLYIDPPVNAVVFCVDEKTAIQALDRTDPVLPLRPGRAEAHGFESVRHGTRSLYVALDVGTGHVQGKVAARPYERRVRGLPRHGDAQGAAWQGRALRRRQSLGA